MDSLYEALSGLKEDAMTYGTQGVGVVGGFVASHFIAKQVDLRLFAGRAAVAADADGKGASDEIKPMWPKAPAVVKKLLPGLVPAAVAYATARYLPGKGGALAESARVGAWGYAIGSLINAFAPAEVAAYYPVSELPSHDAKDSLNDMPLLAGPNLAVDRYLSAAPTTYEPARLNGAPTTYERAPGSTNLQYVPSPD